MNAPQDATTGGVAARNPPEAVAVEVGRLYESMRRELIRLAIVLVDDPGTAEDVVHDAFAATHRVWTDLRSTAAAAAYLRRATLNGARSELRRRRHRRRHIEPLEPPAASADTDVLAAEERAIVLRAVRALPARQREVVLLRYWQGLNEAEIAAALGISAGSVKSAASRGLDKVQRTVERSSS